MKKYIVLVLSEQGQISQVIPCRGARVPRGAGLRPSGNATNPVKMGDTVTGGILRLHDIEDAVKDGGFGTMHFELTITAIPEPSTALLLGGGLLGLAARRRRRKA